MSDDFLLVPRILNGGIAGVIAATSVYPLDLVKTRLQTQNIGPSGERMYNSMFDGFKKIFRNEGFFGMYRGLAVNLSLIAPEIAVKLAGNDLFRKMLQPEVGQLSVYRQALAGALTGTVSIFVTTPMEFLKIQLQDEGRLRTKSKDDGTSKNPKLTARKVFTEMIRKNGMWGVLGVYKGLGPCALRDIFFSIIYFPTFAILYDLGPTRADGEATNYWSLTSGAIAGSISALLATPFDVVKTRMQTLHRSDGEIPYTGIVDCFKKTYKNEGALAFFKGGACRVIVVAPLFGLTQMVYYLGVAESLLKTRLQTIVR